MLVSLADIKIYLGIAPSDTSQDVFLTLQIQIISEAIENYCRRKFNVHEYTQTFYSSDYGRSSYIDLAMYPVLEIDSISQDSVDLEPGYRLQKAIGRISRSEGFFWGTETEIIYTAGYVTLPAVIASAVYSLVQERYTKKNSGVPLNFGSDVQRVSIPGTISIDFDYTLTNNDRKTPFGLILGNYLNILDYYRSDRAIIGNSKLTYVEEG